MFKVYKNTRYVFAFWNQNEKKWAIVKKLFILGKCDSKLMGQFITSMWYNVEMDKALPQAYMIIGISKVNLCNIVLEQLNKNKNGFPSEHDIPTNNVKFCEYFGLTSEVVKNVVEQAKLKRTYRGTFSGHKDSSAKLMIGFNYIDRTLFSTLPEFTICI